MKYFLIKAACCLLLYAAIQYLWYFQFSKIFPQIRYTTDTFKLTEKLLDKEFDIVLLGSSINMVVKKEDRDKRFISQMLDDELQDCKVVGISRPALTVGQFDDIIRFITKNDRKPLYLIEVCLKTFSNTYEEPNWGGSLKKEELVFKDNIETAFIRPRTIFNYKLSKLTEEKYLNKKIYNGKKYLGTHKEILNRKESKEEIIANRYIIVYGARLNSENKKIKELIKLIKFLKRKKIKSLFYITPVNYETGIKYLPDSFMENLNFNIEYLSNLFQTSDIAYINLSKEIPASNFNHLPWFPNGHLDQHGRMSVAKKIKENVSCD